MAFTFHDPAVNPACLASQIQLVSPLPLVAWLFNSFTMPLLLVKMIRQLAPGVVKQVEVMELGFGSPSKLGWWLLTKLPYGVIRVVLLLGAGESDLVSPPGVGVGFWLWFSEDEEGAVSLSLDVDCCWAGVEDLIVETGFCL